MSGYIDIHAHVLPGIDDGPQTLDEALAMAQIAADIGIETIVTTPHLRADFPNVVVDEIGARCEAVRAAMDQAGISVNLVSGAEVSLAWALEASDDQLRQASYGQHGTDLLIETPTRDIAAFAELLFQVRARGYRVTLAHPERSARFQADPAQLRKLVDQGLLLQVNASSLRKDRRGSKLHRLAASLCEDGVAHAIASDAHRGTAWRPISELADAHEVASALVGPARARWFMRDAPAAILAGQELPDPPEMKTRGRFARLFGGG